jgi:hypothetical protein
MRCWVAIVTSSCAKVLQLALLLSSRWVSCAREPRALCLHEADPSRRICGMAAHHVLALPKTAQTATRGPSVPQRKSLNLRLVHPRR